MWSSKHTGCLKKNGILWKNGHNFLQTHPKCKIWGCFGKFRIFATRWALSFSKLKKKWLRKWSLKLPTPSPKIGKILCSQFTLIDPLSHSLGHYGLWTWHIRPRIKPTFTFPSTNVWNKFCFHCKSWKCRESSKECIMWAVNSADFWRGGWQLQASFSQSILLQFWKSQCPSGSKYPEFSKTPPAFAFWMSLRVVMAIFPRNDIFFETPCRYVDV